MSECAVVVAEGGVRASVQRRRDAGVVVRIAVSTSAQGWVDVIKIDAFGKAHWHLYTRTSGERVSRLDGDGALRGGQAVISRLPEILADAGYSEHADLLLDPAEVVALKAAIGHLCESECG